jgi:hypothetical protein
MPHARIDGAMKERVSLLSRKERCVTLGEEE